MTPARRWGRRAAAVAVGIAVALMTAWAAGAIYYSNIPGARLRGLCAATAVLATALAFAVLPRRRRTLVGFLVAFAVLVAWWLRIPASNDRTWQPDVAVAPWATIDGDRVTVHGVRNFEYRTELDYTPHWEDRTYDLRDLDSGDLIAVYWDAGPAIAHIFLSFGFKGRDYLAISIETRKEEGESYSTLAGFFKQYELVYVVADERDVIGVRTTYRRPPEDVYVYRLHGPRENLRRVFLDYIQGMNELRAHPQFYNTLTTNCTTGVLLHARVNPGHPPWSWKVLVSGYFPEYAYELGRLDTSRPYPELRSASRVNDRAIAAGRDPAFSRRIRESLPVAAPAR